MNQLSFNVTAKFTFSQKQEMVLETDITSVILNFSNNGFLPQLTMSFYIDSRHANMLLMPYTVDLTIIEKNLNKENRTALTGVFLSASNNTSFSKREPNQPQNFHRLHLTQSFVHADAYSMVNSTVGGVFNNKNMKEIVKALWSKAPHGSIQLDLGEFDNKEKYEQVWIPDLKFMEAIRYLSQHYGFYSILSVTGCDLEKFYIKSINEIKDPPIQLYMRESTEDNLLKVDELKYGVYKLPDMSNLFNSVAINIPKNINVLKHDTSSLFSVSKFDTIQHMRSMNHVQNTDVFDSFYNQHIKQDAHFISPNPNMLSFKESISNIITNTVRPTTIEIPDPFRFSHWFIGRRLNLESKHLVYSGIDITFFISKLSFKITQGDNKRWKGSIFVELQTASTRNMKV